MLGRIIEARLKSFLLFVFVNMQKELQDRGLVLRQIFLELIDLIKAFFPYLGRDQIMDAHNQYVLVMTAVKDYDLAVRRCHFMDAPQIIVIQFLLRWDVELRHLYALRIDAVEDVMDRAIFSGRIHRLQHDQHLMLVLGI